MSEDVLEDLVVTFQPSDVNAMLLALRIEKMHREQDEKPQRE